MSWGKWGRAIVGTLEIAVYSKAFLAFLAMVDPPFVIPMYLQLIAGRSARDKRLIAVTGILGFFVFSVGFVFLGDAILGLFGISIAAFQLAGGFLMLLMGLEMLAEPEGGATPDGGAARSAVAAGMVPLAIPILAGPGTLSTAVLFTAEAEGLAHRLWMTGVVGLICLCLVLMFVLASRLERLFTDEVAAMFNKVMGLIVIAIAFEFLLHGLAGHFEGLDLAPTHG